MMKRKGSPAPMDVDGSPKKARKGKENDEFCSVNASIVLAVPPVFSNRLRDGVEEMLDSMIMRYAHIHFPFPHFFSLSQIRVHAEWCRSRTLRRAFPRPCGAAASGQPFCNLPCRLQRTHLETDTRHETQYVYSSCTSPRPFLPQLLTGEGEERGLCSRTDKW